MTKIFRLFEELIADAIESVRASMKGHLALLGREITVPDTPFAIQTRRQLEEKYGPGWQHVLPRKLHQPMWVTDLPREFYDFQDDDTGEWRNYDLFMPEGYGEVISGAEREYEYIKIVKKIERDALPKHDYDIILRMARENRLKPSGGAGLGLERLVAYVCGLKHVGEAQPFPRIPGCVPEL